MRLKTAVPYIIVTAILVMLLLAPLGNIEGRKQMFEERLRSALSFHTTEYLYRDIIYDREHLIENLNLSFLDTEILYGINILVRAGIDLGEGLTVDREALNSFLVTLPRAEIFYADADETSIHQYFYRRGIPRIPLKQVALRAAREAVIADALEQGILSRAEQQAETILQGLAASLNMNVEVRFQSEEL